jgi:hypothetical protein
MVWSLGSLCQMASSGGAQIRYISAAILVEKAHTYDCPFDEG